MFSVVQKSGQNSRTLPNQRAQIGSDVGQVSNLSGQVGNLTYCRIAHGRLAKNPLFSNRFPGLYIADPETFLRLVRPIPPE